MTNSSPDRDDPAFAQPARSGATRMADIPAAILAQLNAGQLPTATLAEGLAIDMLALVQAAVPEVAELAAERLAGDLGIVQRMSVVGTLLAEELGLYGLRHLKKHPADTVRGWAAYMVAGLPGRPLDERLELIRPLADDPHFAVREWAWLALRPHLASDLPAALELLQPWTGADSANLRRFAVESTRPRGVWCAHIAALKHDPAAGLALLEPLRADDQRYVQLSVANWLNDASKSQPEWVRALCERWAVESPAPATVWIINHATRTLRKAAAAAR
ncbi:MAG: DNA alkylation repair protein [Herpetosiphonaceae bacterium]|nr:DNA alkylation repair protein [Herpetosiphonaceae bacterium]